MAHDHSHTHHAHHPAPATRVSASLFRMSVAARLGIAALLSAALWAAIGWALA
jgi:hypothetical protein